MEINDYFALAVRDFRATYQPAPVAMPSICCAVYALLPDFSQCPVCEKALPIVTTDPRRI